MALLASLVVAAALAADPAPAATPATTAATTAATGDVYVSSTPAGAGILVDGVATGLVTPTLVRGVSAGKHQVRVEGACARADAEVNVAPGLIARAEVVLVAATATLEIQSSPAAAALHVDGVERGAAPLSVVVPACVEHVVAGRLAGHAEGRVTITPVPYVATPIVLSLVPERFGTLVLDLTPLDARATLDEQRLAPGPQTLEKVPAGPHRLLVEARGYQPHRGSVEVKADEVQRLAVALQSAAPARRKLVRVAANSASSAVALGLGGLAAAWHLETRAAFDAYLAEPSDDVAADIFSTQVEPAQFRTLVAAGAAVAVAGASTALWVTTDFSTPEPTPVVGVGGSW